MFDEEGRPLVVVDPPEGSKYGFPRPFSFKPSRPGLTKKQEWTEMERWFKAHGYPQRLIDEGALHRLRFWPLRRDDG